MVKENVIKLIGTLIDLSNYSEEQINKKYDKVEKVLIHVLETLTLREEIIIKLRWGLDDGVCKDLIDVAKNFEVTRERIRQIEANALRELHHPSIMFKLMKALEEN